MNNFIDEFRNSEIAAGMGRKLSLYDGRPVTIMEVCGTHTMSIYRYGIKGLLPESIRLVSGPGCPVCVTPGFYVDSAVELANREDIIITTFGDMLRVPGSKSSLLKEKAMGRDIRIVYSPLDSLKIAADNPHKRVVFLSIGFETTTPVIALSLLKAKENGTGNFSVLAANKTMPEALKVLTCDTEIGVDGYLYPGHVCAVTGIGFFREIAEKYGIPGVVTGFEPLDILQGIMTLVNNINSGNITVENAYSRVVRTEGNEIALSKMNEVFEPCDAVWRGIGCIKGSGLSVRPKYSDFDAWKVFDLAGVESSEPKGCLCGEILKGKKTPGDCPLFNKTCTPENPVGACMVSSEGTCAAYYKYGQ